MQAVNDKPSVAVIGLGEMGSALGRALLKDGYIVKGWNRSPPKVAALVATGALPASSLIEALTTCEVVVVCVANHAAVVDLLHGPAASAALKGKTLIQMTSRTPAEARLRELWSRKNGVRALEGAIQSYPTHIGTPEGAILYSGPRDVFDRMQALLRCLGGHAVFVGEQIGSSAALDMALAGTIVPGATLAFLQGAAICHAEGAPLAAFLDLAEHQVIPGLLLATLRSSISMIERANYAYEGGAPIDTWLSGLASLNGAVEEAGVNPSWSQSVFAYLRQAAANGHGQCELAAVFEQFRANRSPPSKGE